MAKGYLMLVTLPDGDEPWRLVRAEEEPTPQGTCEVHVYQQTRPGQSGYFRPDTGEDFTQDVLAPRLEAYHMLIPLSAVVVHTQPAVESIAWNTTSRPASVSTTVCALLASTSTALVPQSESIALGRDWCRSCRGPAMLRPFAVL